MNDAIEYPVVLGIDPGVSGGIACWQQHEPLRAFAMPETEGDQIELIRELTAPGSAVAFLELVGGFTGKGQPGSAMFKFGRSFGFTLGVLQTLGVRVELVRPQVWQKPLGLGTASRCATRNEWKAKLRSCAQRLHPKLKPTLATADAILIPGVWTKSIDSEPGTWTAAIMTRSSAMFPTHLNVHQRLTFPLVS